MTAGNKETEREKRLKAALRDNLKRRKQAARKGRDGAGAKGGDAPAKPER